MPNSSLAILLQLVVAASFAYAAYWGLAIRRGFAMRLYRNQALGLCGIAAYFGFSTVFGGFVSVNANSDQTLILLAAFESLVGDIPLFLWIDATVRVARRSDPFERDSLCWSKTRLLPIALIIISTVITLAFAPIALVRSAQVPTTVPAQYLLLGLVPYIGIALTGAVMLSISAVRSKDRTLRKHVKWFGLFFVSLFASLVLQNLLDLFFSSNVPLTAGYWLSAAQFVTLFSFGAYCLYKSARSLAPITSFLEVLSKTP